MPTVEAVALIVLYVVRVRADWTSIDFEQLIKTHKYVTDCLQKGKGHPILNKYSSLYKREHRVMEQKDDFIGNPINMYLLIKRLTTDLDYVEKYIPWIRVDKAPDLKFPSKKHLQDSMVTLWRLQRIYNLNVTHLAAGKLYGHYSHDAKPYFEESLPMLINDCLDLMQRMYWNHYYEVGLLWAVESYNKYHRKEPDEIYPNVDDSAILHHIVTGYIKIGKYNEATEWTRKLMSVRPDMVQDLLQSEDPHHDAGSILSQFSPEQPADLSFEALEDLCRGKPLVRSCKRKSLYCYYKLGPNPFLRLAPFKAEQLYEKPPIFIFYDVVSDTNIETIHGLRTRLKPSTVSDALGDKRRNQNVRTSDSVSIPPTWELPEGNVKSTSEALQLRAAHFTDLNMESAEQLQVPRYGVGGQFRNHFDFFPNPLTENGNRLATVLFYMSDVAQGGATVFREAQLTVWPVKGAALLWYNLLPSGQKDYHTSHAGCPILRGSKWVISLWIYEYGQVFLKPCGLEYQENKEINFHNDIYYNSCK